MSLRITLLVGLMIASCTPDSVPARAVRWAADREVDRGRTVTLRLPEDLATASSDGNVHIAALRDGRRCVLLKTRIGFKDNFEGLLVCSAPLQPGELTTGGEPPRGYVSLAGHELFEELHVRRRIDERSFEVFFDLN